MKYLNFLSTIVVSSLLFTACGGGGDSTPTPAAGGSTRLAQSDIQTTGSLGSLTLLSSDSDAKQVMVFADAVLNATSSIGGGSTLPDTAACRTSGSLTASTTKLASRVGYANGDQLLVTFSNCNSGSGLVLNGSLRMTAQGTIANVGSAYDIRYNASMTNLSFRTASLTTTLTGGMDINSSNTVSAFTVPANQSLTSTLNSGSTPVSTTYRAGTTARSVDTVSPNTASRKLDGTVVIATSSSQLTFDVATPTAFAGTTSSGRFIPNTGVMTFRQSGGPLNASISVSGNTATVSGDTDGDGSLDLSFATTWTALTF
jgi:hypothetical protein